MHATVYALSKNLCARCVCINHSAACAPNCTGCAFAAARACSSDPRVVLPAGLRSNQTSLDTWRHVANCPLPHATATPPRAATRQGKAISDIGFAARLQPPVPKRSGGIRRVGKVRRIRKHVSSDCSPLPLSILNSLFSTIFPLALHFSVLTNYSMLEIERVRDMRNSHVMSWS